jgi:hypothetical protein
MSTAHPLHLFGAGNDVEPPRRKADQVGEKPATSSSAATDRRSLLNVIQIASEPYCDGRVRLDQVPMGLTPARRPRAHPAVPSFLARSTTGAGRPTDVYLERVSSERTERL